MIAIQLDKTQKTPFLVEALDGDQVYKNVVRGDNSLAHTRLENKLSEEFSNI